MTDDLVKRAREVLKDVTPGPWRMESRYSFITHKDTPQVVWDVPRSTGRSLVADTGANVLSSRKDAAFIAAARELVPTMTDRLEAAEKLADALRAFDPQVIGSGPSTNMRMLIDAQQAARAALDEWEKAND